jgi:hypothetical protein
MDSVLVDGAAVAAFARDGVVCLRSVLDLGNLPPPAEVLDEHARVIGAAGHLGQRARPGQHLIDRVGRGRHFPDIDADRGAFDIRRFALQPGDAIFFDFLTVHGAPGFPHPGRRRILSLRYLSAGARHAPRTWRTSPPFDDLPAELPAGAAMDHPLFPVVWPTPA